MAQALFAPLVVLTLLVDLRCGLEVENVQFRSISGVPGSYWHLEVGRFVKAILISLSE